MSALDNKKLLRLIRYAPVGVILVFSVAVTMIAIQDNQDKAAYSIENLRQELLTERKNIIRTQVNQVYNQLILEKSKLKSELQRQVKQRVYEAYSIAHNIYSSNPNKSDAEIIELIKETLRPIRFFNNRGYFFILDADGKVVMHGLKAAHESQGKPDDHKHIKEMLAIAADKNEGFLEWAYQRPNENSGIEYKKVGFVKSFEPFNWIIGTGEYLDDAERDGKDKLLDWFSSYEYGENGHFFVISKDGKLLAHHQNDFLGINLQVGDHINSTLFDDIVRQLVQGGGYIRFQKPLTLSSKVTLEQISYVREFKDWGWTIGTGFYTQTFERYLKKKAEQLNEYNQQSLNKLILLSIFSTSLLIAILLYVSHLIARRFNSLQRRIMSDFSELNNTKDQMEFMAMHDALTGLPNRTRLKQDVRQEIAFSKQNGNRLAIL